MYYGYLLNIADSQIFCQTATEALVGINGETNYRIFKYDSITNSGIEISFSELEETALLEGEDA